MVTSPFGRLPSVGPTSRPNSENFLLRFCASFRASVPAFSAMAVVSSFVSGFGMPLTLSSSAFSWFCEFGHLALQPVVLALQIAQCRQNVVQLIEPLQDVVAALFLLLQQLLQDRHDLRSAAGGHDLALAVGDRHHHAAIHEAAFLGLVV